MMLASLNLCPGLGGASLMIWIREAERDLGSLRMICRANPVCCARDPEAHPRQAALFSWDTLMGWGGLEYPVWSFEEAADAASSKDQ